MTVNAPTTSVTGPSGAFAFFANLRVMTKTTLGFAAILLFVATLGGVGVWEFGHTRDGVETMNVRTTVAVQALDADRGFTELRRTANRYVVTSTEENANAARESGRQLKAKLAAAIEFERLPERKQKFAEVSSGVDQYLLAFETLVKDKTGIAKLVKETLDPAGARVQKDLEELSSAAARAGNAQVAALAQSALVSSLQQRLHVNQMFGRHDETFGKMADADLAALEKTLSAIDAAVKGTDLAGLAAKAHDDAKTYARAADEIRKLDHEAEEIYNVTLTKLARAGGTILQSIVDGATTEQKTVSATVQESLADNMNLFIALSIGAVVAGALLAWFVGRGIAHPIVRLTNVMRTIAGGDKSIAVPDVGRKDEVGVMAQTLEIFKGNLIENDRLQAEQRAAEARAAEQEKQREQERVALEKAAAEQRKKELQDLADSFERSVGGVIANVTGSAERMQSIAQAMMATAEETSRQSTAVAAASEQASANVQTVATASEELAASVAEISRQVSQSSQIAQNAVDEAARTNDTVQSLAETANKIGAVVGLIADIASQTNLLALNATIEAARAGEAGKGFAVVASEVKTLANQTAKATDEISSQVSAIQGATEDAVGAIKTIGDTIGQINSIATMIASAVEEQGAATREIAENVQQAASGTQEVSSNIAGVSQAASDTGSAANDVLSAAGQLADESAALKHEVDNFLRTVRAA